MLQYSIFDNILITAAMAGIAFWIPKEIRITETSQVIKPKQNCLTVVEYE